MKRIDLVRKLEQAGCSLIRYSGASQPVPRHREIKEFLAKHILRKLGVD